MKKIYYSSLILSLLLVGCTNENNQKDIESNLTEEEVLLEELKDDTNVSLTGNDLNISDKEKDYNFRLRMIDIHNLYMNYLLYNIPDLKNTDEYYISRYAIEDFYYKQDGEIMKKVLSDIKYHDPKFDEKETKLNNQLVEMIDLFQNFFQWTDENNLFIKNEEKNDDSYYVFNKEQYDIEIYQEELDKLNNYMSKNLFDYFSYSINFLNENDKVYSDKESMSYLVFESSLIDSKDFIKQELNIILDESVTKAKKENSWVNLTNEIAKINKMNINKKDFIDMHKEYHLLLTEIKNNNSYESAINSLNELDKWYNKDEFLNNYSVENVSYIQTFIDYYKQLNFNYIN